MRTAAASARRPKAGAAIFACVGLACACGRGAPAHDRASPPRGAGSGAAGEVTTIGGASYRLPDAAFADGLPERGPQDSLLLDLPAPATAGADPVPVQVLLVAPSTRAAAREQAVNAYVALDASIAVSLDPRRRGEPLRQADRRVSDAPAGLVQVAVDASDSVGDDVFVRPPIADVHEFVRCSRLGPDVANPLCSQEFAAPGMAAKASYPRAQLRDWDAARTFVLTYLQQHKASP